MPVSATCCALAVSLSRHGDTKGMQDRLEETLASYRESIAIMTRLAAADRNNTAWQRDLAVAYAKASDALGAQDKLEEGLASYRQSLAIMERLAASDVEAFAPRGVFLLAALKPRTRWCDVAANVRRARHKRHSRRLGRDRVGLRGSAAAPLSLCAEPPCPCPIFGGAS